MRPEQILTVDVHDVHEIVDGSKIMFSSAEVIKIEHFRRFDEKIKEKRGELETHRVSSRRRDFRIELKQRIENVLEKLGLIKD